MEKIKVAIVGAGVIGLAIAEALSRQLEGEIVVLEKNEKFGQETSSRNSEVIHAGIYYPQASLKGALCLKGNKMLYDFCAREKIKHKRCGKLIVATNEVEANEIGKIFERAMAIGVPGLKRLNQEEIAGFEPSIYALNGIYSETTGIIDSHGLMNSLYQKASQQGVFFVFESEIKRLKREANGYEIQDQNGEAIEAEWVINCAGLNSDKIAQLVGLDVNNLGYRLHYCKGDYFSITGSKGELAHLVYPPPHEKGYGLGVHATLDLEGYLRLGPDAEYIEQISYDVKHEKRRLFFGSAKKFLPWLTEEMLSPDTAGIRPKLQGPNDSFRDFVIAEETRKGLPKFINLIGIESPGLTAALAIAKYVGSLISD